MNPCLPSRPNWSGISNGGSGGFETVQVNLPASGAGQPVKLRWRMCSDSSVSHAGWRVDTVGIFTQCGTPTPDADGQPKCNANGKRDSNGNCDTDSHCDSYAYGNCYTVGYANAVQPDTQPNGYGYSYSDGHGDCHSYGYAGPDGEAYSLTEASSDSATPTVKAAGC